MENPSTADPGLVRRYLHIISAFFGLARTC